MLEITTLRGPPLLVQSPQLRYTLPTPTKVVSLIVTVPRPLCWTTLSLAELAPPPCQSTFPVPSAETASTWSMKSVIALSQLQRARGLLTFANIAEPDILQRAGALAVDAFQLPGANDDIRDTRAVVEDEYSAVTARIVIGVAVTPTIELFVAVVDRAGNRRRRSERHNRTRASRDVESLSGGKGHQRGEKGGCVQHLAFVLGCVDRCRSC
jgi:hypothetical protein